MMVKLCIPQLLNAISLLSPLLIWRKHKTKIGYSLAHKFVIWHLPISFTYHMLQAVHFKRLITKIAQNIDCVCIHVYAIICSWHGKKHKLTHKCISLCPNIYCIRRIILSNEDEKIIFTCVRLCSLAISGFCFSYHSKKNFSTTKHALICSCLYVFDKQLWKCGHSLFHIMLGNLYNCIFEVINETYSENLLVCHSANNLMQPLK